MARIYVMPLLVLMKHRRQINKRVVALQVRKQVFMSHLACRIKTRHICIVNGNVDSLNTQNKQCYDSFIDVLKDDANT